MVTRDLSDHLVQTKSFPGVEKIIKKLKSKEVQKASSLDKIGCVSQEILKLIQSSDGFLLIEVLDFIERLAREKIIENYSFSTFEMWLNQFSNLSFEDNLFVRGKIVGKWVPREEYQILFPIGMGKIYPGCHYVTAHGSPDLDTTIASFWGWVDAFGARVSEGLHIWNLPGGSPPDQVEVGLVFKDVFGESVFTHIAKGRSSLTLSGMELVSQQGVIRKMPQESTLGMDHDKSAVLLIDEKGSYLGEWRTIDIEGVKFVITLLNQCLRWYENHLHVDLVTLFAREKLTQDELSEFVDALLKMQLGETLPAQEFSMRDANHIKEYLKTIFGLSHGLSTTFKEIAEAFEKKGGHEFTEFVRRFTALKKAPFFNRSGELIENRPKIFQTLATIIQTLDQAIFQLRQYVERLDVALGVKSFVLGLLPQYVTVRTDVEEIRSKMSGLPFLTVTGTDGDGKLYPLGVIYASDLYRPVLGTVSLRDFCNREETRIPPYLDIISVIDHHKSQLQTSAPTMIQVSDVQSSNVIVAESAFLINDKFSLGGMKPAQIEAQIKSLKKNIKLPSDNRILQRLLMRSLVAKAQNNYSVSPEREIAEYFHFLYGILDDTDLLTKVSARDVFTVGQLLNRLKSLSLGKEVEVIHFDDLPRDKSFPRKAALRILQNDEMFSLYKKSYEAKELAVEKNLKSASQGHSLAFFSDTKEQNGCCRVGQSKIFARNIKTFERAKKRLRKLWQKTAADLFEKKNEIDFHLQMISTLSSAKELYHGGKGSYPHLDEIWIWVPETEIAVSHLKNFLSAFGEASHVLSAGLEVEIYGKRSQELDRIFAESFVSFPRKTFKEGASLAVLRFRAGAMNSRKAMISPYLPHLV
jgi:hypothetical protein